MMQSDIEIHYSGCLLAGVDEAGRGPLAGPVIAAAVILDPARPIKGINDSKKLSESKREELAIIIREQAICWAVGRADVDEIDRINILHATMLAMSRAIDGLSPAAEHALIDGNRCPVLQCTSQAIIKGDQRMVSIAAASIIAKVTRDHEMLAMHDKYPEYGFDQHKGYGTKVHMDALQKYGATEIHRRSFSPVRRVLEGISQ